MTKATPLLRLGPGGAYTRDWNLAPHAPPRAPDAHDAAQRGDGAGTRPGRFSLLAFLGSITRGERAPLNLDRETRQ